MKDRLGMVVNHRKGNWLGGSMDKLKWEGGSDWLMWCQDEWCGWHSISCVQGNRGHCAGKEAAKSNLQGFRNHFPPFVIFVTFNPMTTAVLQAAD